MTIQAYQSIEKGQMMLTYKFPEILVLDRDRLREGILALPLRSPICPLCGSQRTGNERLYIRTYGHCDPCEERLISKEEDRGMEEEIDYGGMTFRGEDLICDGCGEPTAVQTEIGAMFLCPVCFSEMEKGWEGLKNGNGTRS